MNELVLSLFPGIGLLDRAFEDEGFCVVCGPDLLWGGDICRFHPPSGVFEGVIGGPPCQPFSPANRINIHRGKQPRHPNRIPEFERCVSEAQPQWFVMENSPFAPLPAVDGYLVRDLVFNNRWLGEVQSRKRRISFGSRDGRPLVFDVALFESPDFEFAVMGNTGGMAGLAYDRNKVSRPKRTAEAVRLAARRPLSRLLELQGLPPDFFGDSPFTSTAKRLMIGNGVPIPMGRAIAKAVRRAL